MLVAFLILAIVFVISFITLETIGAIWAYKTYYKFYIEPDSEDVDVEGENN